MNAEDENDFVWSIDGVEVDSRDLPVRCSLEQEILADARPSLPFWQRQFSDDFCERCDRKPCECVQPANVVLSAAEVYDVYRCTPSGQPTYECGWCGDTFKTRDPARAARWMQGGPKKPDGEKHACATATWKPSHRDEVLRQPWQMRNSRPLTPTEALFEEALIGWLIKQPDPKAAVREIDRAYKAARRKPPQSEEEPQHDRPRHGRRGLPRRMGARSNQR